MRILKPASVVVLAVGGLLAGLTPAFGGVANTMKVVVTPLAPGNVSPPNATYTDPATNFKGNIGYQVDIKNEGKNTSNNVVFRAETYVTDGAELATYAFDSSEGVVCTPTTTPPPGRIQIQCSLGTLRSGQVVPTFFVFFKTPQKVNNGIADAAGYDFINLFYEVIYAEGKNGANSNPQNGFTPLVQALPDFVLGTPDPTLVRSVVLRTGGSFATGNNGIASPTDLYATKSIVPPLTGAVYTTVQIIESQAATCVSTNVFSCYSSQITIPGTFAYLTLGLSQDISNIKFLPCTPTCDDDDRYRTYSRTSTPPATCTPTQRVPIENISVFYVPDGTTTELPVGSCTPVGGPFVPPADRPCISARTVVNDALTGKPIRYDWTLISYKNGLLQIR